MKKLFVSLLLVMGAVCAQAQVYVGGGIGLGVMNYDYGENDKDVTIYKFMPEIGYTLDKNFAVGAVFGWQGSTEGGQKAVSVNPYLRYTFANFKNVSLFVDGTVGYEHRYGGTEHSDVFNAGFKPGVAVALNNKLSFVAHVGFLGYETVKDVDTKAKVNYFGLDLDGNALSFGLYYNF
ncbi:MAG: outer membrane beta-barrel protein [Prevotella sp.]|nr:outer membrane beta-barrel protein [Prevotella sp.]MBR1621140.1 outer membrane beta-barrel protein [Prevotella sp.]